MPTIFTKIITGELPSYKIAETENCLAFLDIFPLHPGHTLVIPKKEVDYLFDLPDELYRELWDLSKKVATALGKAVPSRRVGVAVIGIEVPHAHIHLVPINGVSDIDFSRPKLKLSPEELQQYADKIKQEL